MTSRQSPKTGTSKGLRHSEPLLFEYERKDHPGVDLEPLSNRPLRTGQNPREEIGLPQLGEAQVLRHFIRLSTRNYSIDTGFFPLGSCTMKHNPRLNEKIARLEGFSNIHPLQPEESIQGALQVMHTLQNWLAELTGLPAVSLSPAAGAHGEFAGIMTLRKAHESKGQGHRNILLVPDSAHGTNPATASMCGYTLKVIPTHGRGCIPKDSFEEALGDGHNIAGMMVTNPNTCGLFEKNIVEIVERLHNAGGYFYCDGANFNALVGRIKPADFGVDVMHINLHKTFSTPHGGGGPGSGPICVTETLRPFLPTPTVTCKNGCYQLKTEGCTKNDPWRVKAFHGHFGTHVRALAYMISMGKDGLAQASADAVLSANYILACLKDVYHTPFSSPCMHEVLLTDKNQREKGINTLDIAKALIEEGIHPMTIYFPLVVQGAMLIEPTETETKETLDHFIEVMKTIGIRSLKGEEERQEIKGSPYSTPVRRVDEVLAARDPRLRWMPEVLLQKNDERG